MDVQAMEDERQNLMDEEQRLKEEIKKTNDEIYDLQRKHNEIIDGLQDKLNNTLNR